MAKSIKNILITFIIGCIIFVIGTLLSGGFNYESINEAATSFFFYQLYAFVLGYSNMLVFRFFKS